jgi:hypothetical protein
MVAKRFRCPVLQCRYSSSVGGDCTNPHDLPAATHPAAVPLLDLGATPRQRFTYPYTDFDAGGVIVNPVAMGLTRPFHPGDDNNPQSPTGAGGSRLRIEVVREPGGLIAQPWTGGYRVRIMPPGVLKPMAMSWVDVDNDLPFAVKVANPPPARTRVNLIDSDGDAVDLGGDWWAGHENAIMANPATCPTARWTIKFGDANGTPEPTPPGGVPQWFTLYRGDPADSCSDGWGTVAAAARPNVWVSFSEEVAFSFDPQNLQDWLVGQIVNPPGPPGPGPPPWGGGPPPWAPGPPPWVPGPPPWVTDEISITFETYSNCVYLPYPSLVSPAYPDGPDNFFNTAGSIQDVNDPVNGAQDQATPANLGFTYEPRIGETGLGRVDVQERVNLSPPNDPDGNPIYAWRPYDVDRDGGDVFLLDSADGADSDADGRTDDYIDRTLHAFFFCSRQEAQGLPNDPLVDRFMPLLDFAGLLGPAQPGSTITMPPASFPLANRTTQQVLRCPHCGGVHPITGAPGHPVAPPPGGPPDPVDHSTASTDALANYCEFCGTPFGIMQDLNSDGDFDDPGEIGPNVAESESADLGLAELLPLRTTTPVFSRVSMTAGSGSAEIPFENVLFGPLSLPGPPPIAVRSLPAAQVADAALGVRVPSFQPPSVDPTGTDNPYEGVGLLYETRDEHNRWYYERMSSPSGNPDMRLQARQPTTGAGFVNVATTVTREHLLYDDNGVWDTYYACPDCGAEQTLASTRGGGKQSLLRYDLNADGDFADAGEQLGCLNPACTGHSFDPLHGGSYAPACAGSGIIFWRAPGVAPQFVSATPTNDDQPGPNARLDDDNLTAEEYEPARIRLSVPRVNSAEMIATVPVQLGDVDPGTTGAAPHGALNADASPQATSQSVPLPLRNVGNIALDAAEGNEVTLAPGAEDLTRADGPRVPRISPRREQGTVPVNTGAQSAFNPAATGSTVQPVDYSGATLPPTPFNMMPAYPDELVGAALAYWPGPPATPGPAGLRGGALANPGLGLPARPVPDGTPVGEYAGQVRAVVGGGPALGLTPMRLRVRESRLPADSALASDASPSVRIAPPGASAPRAVLTSWASNGDPTGAGAVPAPDSPHNIWTATAPLMPPPADDPFYDHRQWDPTPLAVSAPQPAELAANAFHVEPFTLFDLADPTRAWLYWHTRRLNAATGQWDSSIAARLAGPGGDGVLGTGDDATVTQYTYDTRGNQRGVRVVALQDQPARHWLFWHSDEEGQQRIGFCPAFDPTDAGTAVATLKGRLLRLTNARLGSAEPQAIEYRNATGGDQYSGADPATGADPLALAQAAFPDLDGDGLPDPLIRKPARDPFVFTKDPWVLERPATPGNPTTRRLHVFFSAGLRHQRNSDICWSMFDAFADWDGDGNRDLLSVIPQANYGKIGFARLDATNGKRLLPFSGTPALRNAPQMRRGEKLDPGGRWQTFASRHLDWVTSRHHPMPPYVDPADNGYWGDLQTRGITTWSGLGGVDPAIYVMLIVDPTAPPYLDASGHVARQVAGDPVGGLTLVQLDPTAGPAVLPVPLAWDARDRRGNRYDERTGLIHITPLNLPQDPALSSPANRVPVTVTIDPSSGVVTFSRPLYNQHNPSDPGAVFRAAGANDAATGAIQGLVGVRVWLDYQPFTHRITTDGNADESPAAVFDAFRRLAVFWHRRRSAAGGPEKGVTTFMYKTHSAAIQVLRPPITAGPTVEVLDPTGAWQAVAAPVWQLRAGGAEGIIYFDPVQLAAAVPGVSLPAEVRVSYNPAPGEIERHRIVGWSRTMRAPTAAVVSEQPVALTADVYNADTDGDGAADDPPDIVKYWLFWSSARRRYTPGPPPGGAFATIPASDVYYAVIAPAFGSTVPE